MAPQKVISLVEPVVSTDTLCALECLLREARAGRLIGIAWVSMFEGYRYEVDIAGETRRCPTFTRGMLCKLDDELARLL
jgi:hypothetical protein